MEIWKTIEGYEGSYEVSNLGNVKSLIRKTKSKNNSLRIVNERILTQSKSQNGYYRLCLKLNSTKGYFTIHRLVAVSFIPNHENKPQVNHINGIKTDNRVENLEWCTAKENIAHSYENGLSAIGVKKKLSKLNDEIVLEIRKSDLTQKKLAEKYNVSQPLISEVLLNKIWKHVY
jgi:hypothetical protein